MTCRPPAVDSVGGAFVGSLPCCRPHGGEKRHHGSVSINLSLDLDVHYGFIYLAPADELVEDLIAARGGQANGLCGARYPGVLAMVTGLHTGTVPFEVAVSDDEPAIGDEWEDVVEASFSALESDHWLTTFDDRHELVLPAATSYRARYCATRMDQAHQADVRMSDEPVIDRYLLQLWPAPVRDDAVLRQTSEVAAYWHEVARTTPPPPPPPTPEERAAEAERQAVEEAEARQRMELDRWDGNLPSELLRSGGPAALRLAGAERRLADEIASLDTDGLRQVAHWAASAACARASTAVLDWAPALDALDQDRALPPPFDDPDEAWERLYGPLVLVASFAEPAEAPTLIDPPAAALATVLAAANPNPAAAAFDALEQAASALADPGALLSALRHELGLG